MKDLQHADGTFSVDDRVADALERLAVVLAESRMSALVRLKPPGVNEWVEFTLGMDKASGQAHVVRARPFSGEPSHLGLDDL